MNRPMMSFRVVMNGPLATAGSIFSLLMMIGMIVPITVATLSVRSSEIPTMNASHSY